VECWLLAGLVNLKGDDDCLAPFISFFHAIFCLHQFLMFNYGGLWSGANRVDNVVAYCPSI
jgi:hypothetical protein